MCFFQHPGMRKAVGTANQPKVQNRLAREPPKNVRNSWVNFRICDAYVPEPVQILMELHGQDQLHGKVIDISDAGSQEEAFAVVEVEGLSQPVVVAMRHIKGIPRE
jgi:hypothetical protein